jgi:hypothetical protein
MTQKIALLLIHGIGKQDENYAHQITYDLKKHFVGNLQKAGVKNPAAELVIEAVYWAPVIQKAEDKLWNSLKKGGSMNFVNLRRLMIDFAGDSIAYQKNYDDRKIYDGVHEIIAKSIDKLGFIAGEKAPLSIVAHGIGSVMISNYMWDLQHHSKKKQLIASEVEKYIDDSPIERGETFCKLFSLGSPLALWSLRHKNFGKPIAVPSPLCKKHYPGVKGEWINYYDKDDIIGYPIKPINSAYREAVTRDIEINVGNIWSSWNPASHMGYWNDDDVIVPVAESLSKLWLKINKKK